MRKLKQQYIHLYVFRKNYKGNRVYEFKWRILSIFARIVGSATFTLIFSILSNKIKLVKLYICIHVYIEI